VDQLQASFGCFRSQQSPRDFKKSEILARRELVADPSYVPSFHPAPTKTTLEVSLTPEADRQLETFLATGNYLTRKEEALLHAFCRWYEATSWERIHLNTKLRFRKK
jgi:hypothetical protein